MTDSPSLDEVAHCPKCGDPLDCDACDHDPPPDAYPHEEWWMLPMFCLICASAAYGLGTAGYQIWRFARG